VVAHGVVRERERGTLHSVDDDIVSDACSPERSARLTFTPSGEKPRTSWPRDHRAWHLVDDHIVTDR
jgi:hypothetical protein